jgi:hypothetical protein
MELTPIELLKIIKGYALQSASDEELVTVMDILSPHTPLLKDKRYKDIYTSILKILAGERDRARNITQDLKDYIRNTDGTFTLAECYTSLAITDVKEKGIIRKALCVMSKNKELEKVGTKTGTYRSPDRTYEVIELDDTVPDPLKIELPLRIDQLCNVYNGMTLLAEGEKSSGKSAFGIETAWLNRNLFPGKVRYMQNGELNKQMLTIRLMKRPQHEYPIKKFADKIEFITRHRDWWDIVNPEGFNVIDYIEEHEKKYLIPEYIARIQERLTTGIALIILQRVPGRDYGTGGAEIRNKPSVIVALKRNGGGNGVVIEDIKSFNVENIGRLFGGEVTNPRGLWRDYKLVDGWKFLPQGDWRTPDDSKKYDYFKGAKKHDPDFPHEN